MPVCRVCTETKPETEFYFRKDSGKYNTACKVCVSKAQKLKYRANSDYYIQKALLWAQNNRPRRLETFRAYQRAAYKANPEKFRQKARQDVADLKDYYVRHLQLPNETIEQTRSRIRAIRARRLIKLFNGVSQLAVAQ